MNANMANLVRNGDFEICDWDYQPRYPYVQSVVHRGRSAVHCRGDAEDLFFRQTVGQVEPGHYIASVTLAAGSIFPPYQFLMQVLLEGQIESPEIRVAWYRDAWEGHWVEFDVPERTEMRIEISRFEPIGGSELTANDFIPSGRYAASTSTLDINNYLFFTNVSVVRLGDLSRTDHA
jgi:hypothetical protein